MEYTWRMCDVNLSSLLNEASIFGSLKEVTDLAKTNFNIFIKDLLLELQLQMMLSYPLSCYSGDESQISLIALVSYVTLPWKCIIQCQKPLVTIEHKYGNVTPVTILVFG